MKIALFSRCLGAHATFFAMDRAPQAFTGVRALIACHMIRHCRPPRFRHTGRELLAQA